MDDAYISLPDAIAEIQELTGKSWDEARLLLVSDIQNGVLPLYGVKCGRSRLGQALDFSYLWLQAIARYLTHCFR